MTTIPQIDAEWKVSDAHKDAILEALKSREPIFHHPEKFGKTKQDIENQMGEAFWEVGASGRVYTRQDVIKTLLERYNDPAYQDVWETKNFALTQIAPDTYLLTYILIQDKTRVTRRSTVWRKENGGWKILYHQGTVVQEAMYMLQLINFYHQAEDYFFRSLSVKCMHLSEGAYAYMTGVPVADLNLVYVTKPPRALDKMLAQSHRFFDQDNLSFVVIMPQDLCTADVEGILEAICYQQTSQSVAMILDLDRLATDQTAGFDSETTIKANDDQLNDWMMPLMGAFESTLEMISIYAKAHENALKKNINLRHFSLYKQGKPIASITLSMYDNTISRIDDVGILPGFQGKGYASTLMRYVLSEAKKLGARYCFLEASDSGLGVYQKLGFEMLFKNNIYSRKKCV